MASSTILLDTNGWLALLNARDALHDAAQTVWRSLIGERAELVFTDWIVAETGNGLARTTARRRFVESLEQMRRSPRVRVVFVDSDIMERAIDLYADRPDKTWGLVDCASFAVMADEGITAAFTTDRHFEQAGSSACCRFLRAEAFRRGWLGGFSRDPPFIRQREEFVAEVNIAQPIATIATVTWHSKKLGT